MTGSRLNLDALPDLPQSVFLRQLAPQIWEQEGVMALWVGGSIARCAADGFSDVDLRVAVAVEQWDRWKSLESVPILCETCVGRISAPFAEDSLLHHLLLRSGEIYDLFVQTPNREPYAEARLILGCRDPVLAARLGAVAGPELSDPVPVDPQLVRTLIEAYWIHTHKHPKVLHRGLDLMAWEGVGRLQRILVRLWHIEAAGQDCGDLARATIHTLTPVVEALNGPAGSVRASRMLSIVGAPMTNRQEMGRAIERLNDAVTETGRVLAKRLEFAYPEELEETVRRSWAEFRDGGL